MSDHDTTIAAIAEASRVIGEAVGSAADADLGSPTPCREYDLRELDRHLTGSTGGFVDAANGALDGDDPWGSGKPLADDWPAALRANLEALSAGWAKAAVWESEIENAQMPAAVLGDLALVEVALHGWDLATATGQTVKLSDATAAEVLRTVRETADTGRQYQVFGPEVAVPDDADDLTRAIGLSGRDPDWRAPA